MIARAILALALAASVLPSTASAQPALASTAASADLDALETRTMAVIVSGAPDIGTRLMGSARMMEGRVADLAVLDTQLATALPVYGRALSWERIRDRRFGANLVLRRYIVTHEKMLTVWFLTYIRTGAGWEVAGVNFNDQLQALDPPDAPADAAAR